MLKKFMIIMIIINVIFVNLNVVFSDDEDEELVNSDYIEVANQIDDNIVLNSRIAVAYDRKSGNVIWGKCENKRTAMASTTKIMTAIVAIERCNDLFQKVTISRKGSWNRWFKIRIKTK